VLLMRVYVRRLFILFAFSAYPPPTYSGEPCAPIFLHNKKSNER